MPDGPDDPQRWRAAQEGADELARMGIDPRALGLTPPATGQAPPPGAPAGPERAPADPPARSPGPGARPAGSPPSRPPGPVPPAPPPGPVGPAPSPPQRVGGPPAAWSGLERLVAAPSAAPPAGWRHRLRAAALGVLQPGAAAAVQREQELVARARARCPEPRAVAFLAGKGGVGTTTTAAGVALTLATLRPDPVALVCARSGTGSIGHRLAGAPAPAVASLVSGAATQPAWAHDRLAVVDGAPWHSPLRQEELLRLLAGLRTRHPLTLLDIGNDLAEAAQAALRRCDQVVLVTTASQDAVEATRIALSRVHQADPFRLGTVVVALTSLHPRQFRHTARRLRLALGPGSARLVPVPYDPALATGHPLDLARARPATREAYLRIAGLIAEPGESEAWFSRPVEAAG